MKVEVSPDNVMERTADSRGRITLGSEYADETVEVIIVE